ncbi:MAG: Asp-tRNA(Asn)/Glu-tRNA(Gln) amidotransferase subunit GatA [Oscillospiraceae bacterium]|nr:Asp-tRNA(Asn)/Glu-tRNA(Gln) amidotransferase subunit GatA [Oscillospiraceae bacterium]
MTALELSMALKSKEMSVTEAVLACVERIREADSELNSFINVCADSALEQAARVQKRIDGGEALSPLAGVPVALKDNISTRGVETTCASKMLGGYVPVYNATVVDRLEAAGMVIVGKLNMDEFAMGGSSETSYFGAVKNPLDKSRVAGGSSGGSAAAVAAGLVPLALGSDTGGSIRQPCSFCGVTGIKPTYGAVSRYGLIAYASSLDQIGTLGNHADDCAALLSVISGKAHEDGTCILPKPFEFENNNAENLSGVKIGLPRNYFEKGIDVGVKTAVLEAAKRFEKAGACIEEFEMPFMDYAVEAYYIIACAEASSNLSRYDGIKYGYRSEKAETLSEVYRMSRSEGFGLEVKRRIMLGSFVLSSGYYDAYYKKALQTRALIKCAYDELFQKYDMLLSPVAPTTAYKIGENINDPLKMYMGDIYTVSVNLAGLPAVSLPCGRAENNMPVGFQLIGEAFSENKLIHAARGYEQLNC